MRRIIAILGVVVCAVLFGGVAARAATPNASPICATTTGSKACLDQTNHTFKVTDTAKDGHHSESIWASEHGGDRCQNYDGYNSITTCYNVPAHDYVCWTADTLEGEKVLHTSAQKCEPTY